MATQMKDSGIPWIGQIPEHWGCSPIGQYFQCRNVKVSDKEYPPLSVTKGGILPQLENVAKTNANDDRKQVLKGDFVINSRSDRKQSCGVALQDGSVSLINIVIYCYNNGFSPEFARYALKNYGFAEEFYRWGNGIVADLWTTKWDSMKRISVPIPPLAEQETIAGYLDGKCKEIDELVAIQERMIEELKAYRQSVITEAVTKGLKPNTPLKDSNIPWIGQIPEHWEVGRLKYLSELITDGTHVTPEYIAEGVPFLSIKDISSGKIDFSDTKFISKEQHEVLSQHAPIKRGDILFTRIGTLGVFVKVDTDIIFDIFVSLGLIKVRKGTVNTEYLVYYLSSSAVFNYINSVKAGGGTSAAKFNLGDVTKTFVLLPPLPEQEAIATYLDTKCKEIDELISIKQKKIAELKEFKKSMIYEYVTGKKQVTLN